MEKSTIYHRPEDSYLYLLDSSTLYIQIRTKRNDIERIGVIYGDPFDWHEGLWVTEESSMSLSGSDDLFDYWSVAIETEMRRLRYGFRLKSSSEEAILTEKGYFEVTPEDPGHYFCKPYIHKTEVFSPPEWVKDTVWYQIFPERFSNGTIDNDPPHTKAWGSEAPAWDNFFGGDLDGVIHHLSYLEDLGISGIYFTPIFKAHSNHKYDTIDYMDVDPQFGTKETLKRLVEECHKRGIKVMLDAVFNHSGFYFPPFQNVLKNGENSPFKEWFHIRSFPVQTGDRPNYETFAFSDAMPKLNTYHPDVKKYLLDVAKYWIKECNIDGWRLDVANEVDHQFWRQFREEVKAIKPDVYILGEIWHDSTPWLRGDQFDAVMNYPFMANILNLFANETISVEQFVHNMGAILHSYPINVLETTFNLVGSHDTPRILTECKDDIKKTKLIYTMLLTFLGSPCIYYGDEIGMTGGGDPDCRKCMEWDTTKHNQEIFQHIQKLIALRKQEKLLANKGRLQFLSTENNKEIVAFKKYDEESTIIVALNPSTETNSLSLPAYTKDVSIRDVWTDKEIILHPDNFHLELEPYSFVILLIKDNS
ncbi:alpha-glycosidase [Bacillus sp. CECT 9360]|uniref:alpha-glycosidase n=1 Tax=Bacillus sp. CECT 9360 TaxID=2845821 RepID=UPI001E4248F9|nr:alpha-glycosidase [Bacillus sp. CECT 9360]CAH0344155.1 Neopullulanase [Bacillus sp. CECT 9360]